jgi:general secretion pathway protein G
MQTRRPRGFTLIELLIVLAIVGTLLAIAVPSYFASLDNARETALKQSLSVMRTAIDHYHGDRGRYPESLRELVEAKYLRSIPADPVTGQPDTWVEESAAEAAQVAQGTQATQASRGGIRDVHSGTAGSGRDGTPYASW